MFSVHYFSFSQVSTNFWNMAQKKWARWFDWEDGCQQPHFSPTGKIRNRHVWGTISFSGSWGHFWHKAWARSITGFILPSSRKVLAPSTERFWWNITLTVTVIGITCSRAPKHESRLKNLWVFSVAEGNCPNQTICTKYCHLSWPCLCSQCHRVYGHLGERAPDNLNNNGNGHRTHQRHGVQIWALHFISWVMEYFFLQSKWRFLRKNWPTTDVSLFMSRM